MTDYSDEQIEALIAAATPEPWCYYGGDLWCNVTADEFARADRLAEEHDYSDEAEGIFERSAHVFCGDPERREDAAFIAAARELVPSLLARAQQAEAELTAARSVLNMVSTTANLANDEAAHLRAELAEANAENEALRQVAQSDRETAKDYADEVVAAHAERDRLAAQVAAVRMTLESMESYGLPALVVTPQGALTWAVAVVRAALDGTEQDGESR